MRLQGMWTDGGQTILDFWTNKESVVYYHGVCTAFLRKVSRKHLFRIKIKKNTTKSVNRKQTWVRHEFSKRGIGPLDEEIYQIPSGCDSC